MKENGGPAFPRLDALTTHDKQAPHTMRFSAESVGGMTLRDYFAAQCLAAAIGGLRANPAENIHEYTGQFLAREAYQLADAMLAERSKP